MSGAVTAIRTIPIFTRSTSGPGAETTVYPPFDQERAKMSPAAVTPLLIVRCNCASEIRDRPVVLRLSRSHSFSKATSVGSSSDLGIATEVRARLKEDAAQPLGWDLNQTVPARRRLRLGRRGKSDRYYSGGKRQTARLHPTLLLRRCAYCSCLRAPRVHRRKPADGAPGLGRMAGGGGDVAGELKAATTKL